MKFSISFWSFLISISISHRGAMHRGRIKERNNIFKLRARSHDISYNISFSISSYTKSGLTLANDLMTFTNFKFAAYEINFYSAQIKKTTYNDKQNYRKKIKKKFLFNFTLSK